MMLHPERCGHLTCSRLPATALGADDPPPQEQWLGLVPSNSMQPCLGAAEYTEPWRPAGCPGNGAIRFQGRGTPAGYLIEPRCLFWTPPLTHIRQLWNRSSGAQVCGMGFLKPRNWPRNSVTVTFFISGCRVSDSPQFAEQRDCDQKSPCGSDQRGPL